MANRLESLEQWGDRMNAIVDDVVDALESSADRLGPDMCKKHNLFEDEWRVVFAKALLKTGLAATAKLACFPDGKYLQLTKDFGELMKRYTDGN